jgi:hypothetical protein
VFVTGITSFTGTTDSTNVTTGIVTVAGGVGIKKSLNVGAGLSVSGISTFARDLNVGGNFKVSGISTFVGNVTFEGGTISLGDADTDNVVFTADVNSNILPNTNATFDIGSGTKKWKNGFFSGIGSFGSVVTESIDATGELTISDTTQSTSKDTGCLIIEGGLGVEKNANIGGMLNVIGITTCSNGLNVTGNITASGGLGDFTTPNSGSTGGVRIRANATTGNAYLQFTNNNATSELINVLATSGNIAFSGNVTATDFNSTSDLNLKENIKTVENSLNTLTQLRGVSFDWKETGKSSYGVIAQELEEILPDLVNTGEVKSVNYNGIIGVLIEAVKEQQKEIDELKRKLV